MTELNLDLSPEPPGAGAAVLAARHRRALVVGLGGGRDGDALRPKSVFTERRLRASDTSHDADVPRSGEPAQPGARGVPARHAGPADGASPAPQPGSAAPTPLRLDDALVVPAGALVRGYVRCRALLLVGDIVGNVHCTAGPVVVRAGASLKGRLVACGDVYVCGSVGDTGGGAVISTRGKLTLAPGARVDGDVRSGRLDIYDGAMLQGVARRCED